MKKISLVVLLLLNVICLTACSGSLFSFLPKSDYRIAVDRYEEIMTALEAKDSDALKSLFSAAIQRDQEALEKGVNYAIDIFKGEVISSKNGSQVSKSVRGGQTIKEVKYMYTIETDVDTYMVFFIEITENDYDADEIGLYMLQIMLDEDRDGNFDWGEDIRCPGVWIPQE